MKRGALLATSLGLLAVSLGLLASEAPAKKHKHKHKLTAAKAEAFVHATLVSRGLSPSDVHCSRSLGGYFYCGWHAGQTIRHWPYHCRGHASVSKQRATVQRCRLQGPELAPLRSSEALRNWQPKFGFNEDWLTEVQHVQLAADTGADTNRIPFYWSVVEPQRSHYNWSGYDQVYAAMKARHIRPILAMTGSPCWTHPKRPCTPTAIYPPGGKNLRRWARLVRKTVRRYPKIAGIEVWNEPNLTGFWLPKPNPRRYAHLLRITSRAVKKANSNIPVIFGGLVPQFGEATRGMDSRVFQRRAYKAGAGRYVDGFAVHPYVFPSNDPNLIFDVRLQMAVPKGIAARYGYPATPLWVTEFGLSTVGDGAVGLQEQASKLVALYQVLREIPGVPVLILHRLLDLSPSDPNWQAGMGIFTYGGAPKPAFCALAKIRVGSCILH